MPQETYFIAVDGDNVGRKIEQLILKGNLLELSIFSKKISESMQTIESLVLKARGKIHMIGGDSLLGEIMDNELFMSSFISAQINLACSFCLGLGSDPVKAYLALKFAKSIAPGTMVKTEEQVNTIRFKKINIFGYWEEVSE